MNATEQEIELFKLIIPDRNFITPMVIEYKRINNFIVEISKGYYNKYELFGFTVLETFENNKPIRRFDLDECLLSLEEVKEKESYLIDLHNTTCANNLNLNK